MFQFDGVAQPFKFGLSEHPVIMNAKIKEKIPTVPYFIMVFLSEVPSY